MQLDLEKFVAGLHDYIGKALRPIAERLASLEARPEPVAIKGDQGEKGEPGKDGEHGKSLTVADVEPLVESMHARWALDFERRAQGVLERAVDRLPKPENGKDGEHGKDGADGLGFDDLTVEHDGERGFTIKFMRGDQVKAFAFSVPAVLDRGYWKDGVTVAKGDGMTHAGSYWIAQKDTSTKPDTGNPDWRLAVKKGRDGKDGDRGDKGEPGEKGLPGLNGRDLR
jgi:hypothetical protein